MSDKGIYIITGMPRSGTSFLCTIFNKFGDKFKPNLICNTPIQPLDGFSILSEPSELSHSRMSIKNLNNFLLNIISEYSVFQGTIPVVKHFYFSDNLDQIPKLSYIKKIIVCTRDIPSWVQSMNSHAPHSIEYLKSLFNSLSEDEKELIVGSNYIESFGQLLYNRCKQILSLSIPTLHFDFNNLSSIDSILNDLNFNKSFRSNVLENWEGSRFK